MTPQQRRKVLSLRKNLRSPWHSPPHRDLGQGYYHLTAACYEHRPVLGATPERMASCESRLLAVTVQLTEEICAWCVLPNHYHLLVRTYAITDLLAALGQFHGRQSYLWNDEDNARGRRVWHNCAERAMRSERHVWATMNYVHHNPVRHGYVQKWQDWPFSSAAAFLEAVGRDKAEEIWKVYPVLDYGRGWDDPGI